ncbi:hypothetical protein GTQ34_11735 [Muricauda sp. JGD-17]|uniref:Uncharacterized protein n=1 Tax=Flagellimonas ochracea TaxID=2696472 RepID=A0A964WYH6_9FLAO|nr:hypothetical protein [Allomuricauda ochracea]NAY92589.1 hypothetical protein [Allomuricauda ochracea]
MKNYIFKWRNLSVLWAFIITGNLSAQEAEIALVDVSGEDEAVAAASKILHNAGGKQVWSKKIFIVYEKAFLRNGTEANLKIIRDLDSTTRRIESRTDTSSYIEYIGVENGCTVREGNHEEMEMDVLQMERQGLKQSPYYIYHRLAKGDPHIRVELTEDQNRLNIYDRGKLLCWFLVDANGKQYSWGNYYNGKLNQHYYGPYKKLGDAILPSWGTSMDGGFRFEYLVSEFLDENVEFSCDHL